MDPYPVGCTKFKKREHALDFLCYNESIMEWEKITNIILIVSIVIVGLFALLGLYQWISRKSLKKVDKQLLWMILPLALMVITYLICDKVLPHFISNYPVRPDGSGEPSFPSTHVMVVATIFFCVSAALSKYTKSKVVLAIIDVVMFALASITATGRVLANKHSIVDVIGGVVFAFIFYEIYCFCVRKKKSKNQETENE